MNSVPYLYECRYIIQMLSTVFMLSIFSVTRRKHFILKVIIGIIICIGISLAYIPLIQLIGKNLLAVSFFSVAWYHVFVPALLFGYLQVCFKIKLWETLFRIMISYATYELAYVLYWGIMLRIFSHLKASYYLNLFLAAIVYLLIAVFVYFLFAKKLNKKEIEIPEDKKSILTVISLMIILIVFDNVVQFINAYLQATIVIFIMLIDAIGCVFILLFQLSLFKIDKLNFKVGMLERLLYEKQKQYEISKENIEIINRKCHDLKHQIQAFKLANHEERESSIEEIEKSVMIYDAVVKTDNEVLNTILTEKTLFCENHKIKLSVIADITKLNFIDTIDLYTILGNALDNAIESVIKLEEAEKRVIGLTITTKDEFLCIQTINYYQGTIAIKEGLPSTAKTDFAFHGFGISSMRQLAGKYEGNLAIDLKKEIFTLQIVIPIPQKNQLN